MPVARPPLTLVVSGPSGAGKSTLCERYVAANPETELMITTTTRPIRSNEVDGEDYHFVSRERFVEGIQKDEYLEYAMVHGQYFYGSPRREVERARAEGKDVILEIDVQGGLSVKSKVPESVLLFVLPSNLRDLRQRLVGRGTDSDDSIRTRMESAKREIERLSDYQYFIFNDDLEDALRQFELIVRAERQRITRYDVERLFSPRFLDSESTTAPAP